MNDCTTCGQYMFFPDRHSCHPEWEVRDPDRSDDDEWEIVRAMDDEDAAAKFAEECDSEGGEGPRERKVIVREKGATEAKTFAITFEYSVDYSTNETA